MRVQQQQAQQLPSGVTAGTDDCDFHWLGHGEGAQHGKKRETCKYDLRVFAGKSATPQAFSLMEECKYRFILS
jgi:hypothetical protein